jgi:hypothetical protein
MRFCMTCFRAPLRIVNIDIMIFYSNIVILMNSPAADRTIIIDTTAALYQDPMHLNQTRKNPHAG